MKTVLASANNDKLREFHDLFLPTGLEIIPQGELNITEIEETGLSFIENAILKARHASYYSKLPAIGDDSGLEIQALNGAPGIYSARYAGANVSAQDRLAKLLEAMANVPDGKRQARFCCVLAYLRHPDDPMPIIAQGFCSGEITHEPIGKYGFGYDPIMYLPDYQCTVAELLPTIKNKISHRANALKSLFKQLKVMTE